MGMFSSSALSVIQDQQRGRDRQLILYFQKIIQDFKVKIS